jgi:transcriptional regulator with XRE-family HTH domain
MTDTKSATGVAGHFGRELRRTRIARGLTIAELARRTKINAAHLSRIELGQRPPTDRTAAALDKVFPERQGWFSNWQDDSQSWPEIPAAFRHWPDYEDRTTTLRVWMPGIVHGLLQTEDYARALIAVFPDADRATAAARLRNRMERQQHFWDRNPSVLATFVVDELSLYRRVRSSEVMATQLDRLLEVAALPTVTLQVMPAIEHPANNSGIMLADSAAWCEHAVAGYVFTEPGIMRVLAPRFDSLRAESYRASESVALLRELRDRWATGVSPLTAMGPAGTA